MRPRILAGAVCAAALVMPAAADAAPNWVRVLDPAPGERLKFDDWIPPTDLAVVGRTPYLASEAVNGDLTVWRPDAAGQKWIQVGDVVGGAPLRGDFFTIGADADRPWIAWAKERSGGGTEIHVARLVGNHWEEPATGWPFTDQFAGKPRIVLFDGRPYVTIQPIDGSDKPWASDPATAVTRLSSDGTAVESVADGLPDGCIPELTASSGRLYTTCGTKLLRLSADETAWETVATHSEPFRLVNATGTLYLLGASGTYLLNAHDEIEDIHLPPFDPTSFISAAAGFEGRPWVAYNQNPPFPDFLGPVLLAAGVSGAGSWLSAPSPELPNHGSVASRLIEDADGNLWMAWWSSPYNTPGEPFEVHVARFAEQGEPFDFAPDPAGDDSASQPPPQPQPDAGGGGGGSDDDGFTTPDGTPATPPVAGPPLGRGACANPLVGTAHGERLVGTVLGDRIHGYGGADHLFGRGGSDCLWGGTGNDFVSGGGSADALTGGRGNDRIVPGGGRDDVAAGAGADSINAVGGGVDRINCGPGRDTVKLSPNDLIKGCERVVVVRR